MSNKGSKQFSHLQRLLQVFCLLIVLLPLGNRIIAQPIPVGDIWEDHFRTLQLLSDSTTKSSFSNRPVWNHTYEDVLKKTNISESSLWGQPLTPESIRILNHFSIGAFDPVLTNTFNSALPYGGNNEAAWYGRGNTAEIKAGGWITSDYFTLTFRPHLSYQQNTGFKAPRFIRGYSEENPSYRSIIPNIDMPFRFGPDGYSTLDLGHSSARLHYNQIEAGISSENLWWGPGVQNALVLSNNAPGLRHVFLGTRSPLKLPLNIADLEFRLIGAWPKDSDYFDLAEQFQQDRFMSGANIVFSPSIISGLHLGFIRAVHLYVPEEGLTFRDFISSISFGDRQTSGGDDQNQLVSVFFRWVFPESGAEVYAEYFREDSYFNSRDLFLEPDHDRAYTIGAQKIIKSDWINFLKVNVELNNLVAGRVDEVRPQVAYYGHSRIKQGHTNGGQLLGATIGPGSGSQYLGVEGYFDKGMLGLFVQRVENNDFFHFEYYDRAGSGTGIKDIWRHRIDLNIGLKGHYKTGPLLFSGKIVWNKNYNYGRFNLGDLDVDFDSVDKQDIVNLYMQLTARYIF